MFFSSFLLSGPHSLVDTEIDALGPPLCLFAWSQRMMKDNSGIQGIFLLTAINVTVSCLHMLLELLNVPPRGKEKSEPSMHSCSSKYLIAWALEEFLILSSLCPMISTNGITQACSYNACLVSCHFPRTEELVAWTKKTLSLPLSTGIQAFNPWNCSLLLSEALFESAFAEFYKPLVCVSRISLSMQYCRSVFRSPLTYGSC